MLIFNIAALAALVPAAIQPFRRETEPAEDIRDFTFWAVLSVAIAGSAAWTWVFFASKWQTGMAASLWITVAGAYILFALISLFSGAFARLLALFGPYTLVLATIASVWAQSPARTAISRAVEGPWLDLHIAISVVTYALVTLAAMAAFGVFLQERALKARAPSALTAMLPSVTGGESLQVNLLTASAIILGFGLLSGALISYLEGGALLPLSHKVFLSLTSFAVIVALLVIHRAVGLAGRRAARYLLLAYLLLTLGYPGVKFVTDVILS